MRLRGSRPSTSAWAFSFDDELEYGVFVVKSPRATGGRSLASMVLSCNLAQCWTCSIPQGDRSHMGSSQDRRSSIGDLAFASKARRGASEGRARAVSRGTLDSG